MHMSNCNHYIFMLIVTNTDEVLIFVLSKNRNVDKQRAFESAVYLSYFSTSSFFPAASGDCNFSR